MFAFGLVFLVIGLVMCHDPEDGFDPQGPQGIGALLVGAGGVLILISLFKLAWAWLP